MLILGQYSTGKTSFIKKILKGESYQGSRIGAEPTTDSFHAVMHNSGALGKEKRTRDGQIVTKLGTEAGDDFGGLAKFGMSC